jgi:hypothetical protein
MPILGRPVEEDITSPEANSFHRKYMPDVVDHG